MQARSSKARQLIPLVAKKSPAGPGEIQYCNTCETQYWEPLPLQTSLVIQGEAWVQYL